jgi:microcystin-dependent protein
VQELPISSFYIPGMMMLWAGATAPAGWMLCQGQSLVRADYLPLFNAIGTAYGTADGAHFSLPDMRGRVAAGVDGTGRLTGATVTNPHLPGGSGGQEQEQAYADVNVSGSVRSYGASYGGGLSVHVEMDTWNAGGWGGANGGGPLVGDHSHHMAGDFAVGGSVAVYTDVGLNSAGGGYTRAVTNVQPTLMLNYIIKV